MKDVLRFINGRAYKKEELLTNGKYKVLRVGNFFTNNEWYYSDLELPDEKYCNKGDLLYAWSASFGPKIWDGDKSIFHYHIWNVDYSKKNLFREYLFYFLLFDKTQVLNSTTGSTMIHVSMENMNPRLLPIPPLKEQKRIISKIETLLPLIDMYEVQKNALDLINSTITDNLHKSVLQEAIQGRLVPQIESEGTAEELLEEIRAEKQRLVKEGKLKKSALANESRIFRGDDNKYYEQIGSTIKEISEEIPFDIPTSWQWCRIESIFQINPKNDVEDDTEVAFVPMEAIKPGYGSSFTFQLTKWKNIKRGYTHFADGDIAFAKITPCFQNRKSVIFHNLPSGIGAGTTELKVLRPMVSQISPEYILAFLQSSYFIDEATFKGTANQQRIISGYVENKLFPLPPIEEQRRIAHRLQELFELTL